MTAFGTTWNAWLGFGAAIVCILLVLHVIRRVSKRSLLDEADWNAGFYGEIVGIVLLAAVAIFLFFFSQRAGEAEDRPSSVEERRAMEKSIEEAPPMPTKVEIKEAKKQQDNGRTNQRGQQGRR